MVRDLSFRLPDIITLGGRLFQPHVILYLHNFLLRDG
jgi:hypothetical protein